MKRFRRHIASFVGADHPAVLSSLLIAVFAASNAAGDDLVRVWVDWSGTFSVEATLVEVQPDSVLLMTTKGRRMTIPLDKLSEEDQEYVETLGQPEPNVLRDQPPKPRDIEPLAIFDLPAAESVAKKGSLLDISSAHRASIPDSLPGAIAPDRSPVEVPIKEQTFELSGIGSHDVCSEFFTVGTLEQPALGVSISNGFSIQDNGDSANRLIRLDAETSTTEVIWKGPQRIQLLDHHLPSGRSLVLVGHDSLGHGGQVAIASGWNREAMFIRYHRRFDSTDNFGRSSHMRWAKLIDDEHALLIVDDTLLAANLVSGKVRYRIESIHAKSIPVLSGGRRFVAVPTKGAVCLYRTQDGAALGQIGTGSNALPVVQYSPSGDALAVVTSRRMRIWDLESAVVSTDIETIRGLGTGRPTWIDNDLVLTSSGMLISIFRGLPVWRYEISGTITKRVGDNVAIMRKYPQSDLRVIRLPHDGAHSAMQWIDAIPGDKPSQNWRLPGRSVWRENKWADQDVRISAGKAILR